MQAGRHAAPRERGRIRPLYPDVAPLRPPHTCHLPSFSVPPPPGPIAALAMPASTTAHRPTASPCPPPPLAPAPPILPVNLRRQLQLRHYAVRRQASSARGGAAAVADPRRLLGSKQIHCAPAHGAAAQWKCLRRYRTYQRQARQRPPPARPRASRDHGLARSCNALI